MELPKQVTLVEVGPRDGLQNETQAIPTATKIEFIHLLSQTGLSVIEATSFVSPQWVPQLSDGKAVLQGITKQSGIRYPVLVPNKVGLEHAMAAGATEIAVFTAASDTFSKKNTNVSMRDSLKQIEAIMLIAQENNIAVRGYISCVLGCPYEGSVPVATVIQVTEELIRMGCYEVSLGDTIGIGTANQVTDLIGLLSQSITTKKLAVHFHDTYGQALTNIYAALIGGITTIDCSVGGLGGCPYAPGAGGNVATEDVLYLLNGLGIETGINMTALLTASRFIFNALNQRTRSKAAQALLE
jgi:hydroxymethylglutaryl-CoA lyase